MLFSNNNNNIVYIIKMECRVHLLYFNFSLNAMQKLMIQKKKEEKMSQNIKFFFLEVFDLE